MLAHWGHFPDDILKCIFLNENVWISVKISLKFVLKGPISNIPVLVQIMAWRRTGGKPLSEPMLASLLTHICVTRPQWVNELLRNDLGPPSNALIIVHINNGKQTQYETLHYFIEGWQIQTPLSRITNVHDDRQIIMYLVSKLHHNTDNTYAWHKTKNALTYACIKGS